MSDFTQITNVTEVTKIVRLSYLQTVAALDDSSKLNDIAGVGGANPSSSFTTTDPGSPGFLGIGSEGPSTQTSSFTDSGWSITRTWLETYWDKIRWAIGIREIGIYSFLYASAGEFVSIPYSAPTDIAKVSLRVDESIPNTYPNTQRWIQYFVSGDNGSTWNMINPLDKPVLFSDSSGRPVPKIINYNPDFHSEDDDENKFITLTSPVKSVRLRVVFSRPTSEQFDRTSPVLKSYRLLIYPKGGLL